MQNKRGIAQAFGNPPKGIALRRANLFDVFDLSRVLIRSITELCAADHKNDPDNIALWTANKSPEAIRGWIESGALLWLAEQDGAVAGIGGIRDGQEVSLLYVDPDHARHGIGSALLARLERELSKAGCRVAYLDASCTGRDFYAARGWEPSGTPGEWHGIPQFPMRKSLHPTD
ncbi:GNAT family N-acetyltransferase [Ruegeria sp.]|uniref:GNAT family N-acetyltransferase n=1 Tax=Ruegeria sp. TaxID=1879320 RepID=UPI002318F137|nr:GNAT family N-acetyltransferase [Ruegeria sp.]MDA7963159.1 GNAT family N-acetyltransferase [Ruegeria sp.]